MSSVPSCLLTSLPIIQPPHLEGNAALATEILPGPPSLDSVRQVAKKSEPRKFPLPSYLPFSDPGTTYTSLAGGLAAMALDDNGPRRKRVRMDKRVSARQLAGNVAIADSGPMLDPSQAAMDDCVTLNDDERSTSHSRSASVAVNGDVQIKSVSANGTLMTNGKGKGKERENLDKTIQVRVKEEPVAVQLSDIPGVPTNDDHCSSCSSAGALVYCDGCPRAFHLWCLDPPMDPSDFPEGEESWFCPSCKANKAPSIKQSHTFLSPLIQQLNNAIPTEFRLPEEIRTFFRDVGTGLGGRYEDNSSVKVHRIGRHGFGEERDPYRLKDNRGAPVICFKCGKSALPDESASGNSMTSSRRASSVLSPSRRWKSMISCDFCPLHWHVDCLDPPLSSLPPMHRKWKCPNHASGSAPKTRIPRTTAPSIDILEPHQRNNGNIEVISSETPSQAEEKMSVDEVLINGRRYRVPERIIVLDFWDKIRQQKAKRMSQTASVASSPLTSLSSLDDPNDQPAPSLLMSDRLPREDVQVAELLCQLQSRGPILPSQGLEVRVVAREDRASNRPQRAVADRRTRPVGGERVVKFRIPRSRLLQSSSTSLNKSVDGVINGRGSMHSDRLSSASTAPNHDIKVERDSSSISTRSLRNAVKTESDVIHHNRNRASERQGVRSSTAGSYHTTNIKPSSSPLKIRIPGRLLQRQPSNTSASVGNPFQQFSSSTSTDAVHSRKSCRHPAPADRSGSERSMSVDRGHDIS